MEKAPGVVIVVMRDAMGVGAYRGVRKTGVEEQWELARVECRHGPGRYKSRGGCEAGGGESGLVRLRAGGAGNGGGARCGVCGDARCDRCGCISRVEKGGGGGAEGVGANRTSSLAEEGT